MATLEQLERALVNADRAGDVEAATALAGEVKRMRSAPAAPPKERPNPFKENSFLENVSAGLANVANRTILGASQLGANLYPGQYGRDLRANLANQKQRDELINQQINQTGGGLTGGVIGNTALAAGTMAIPGANTLIGSAATGAGLGAIQPVSNEAERGWNTVIGAGAGAGGKVLGDRLGQALAGRLQNATTQAQQQNAQNVVRNAAVTDAQGAGYIIPPTQTNPSFLNRALEGMSGKIATAQNASAKNQGVTNTLVRQELGLPADAALSGNTLQTLRANAGQAYEAIKTLPTRFQADAQFAKEIASLGDDFAQAAKEFPEIAKTDAIETLQKALSRPDMSPTAAIELVKKLRFDASKNLKSFDDAEKAALGMAQRKAAEAIDSLVERNLAGNQSTAGMAEAYRQARQLIAKAYDVESALNESTGNVSARVLGRLMEKGKPLTGGLAQAGRFSQAFPKAAQDVERMGSLPQVSPLDYMAGILTGTATGSPLGAAALLARPAVRSAILSKPYQAAMAQAPMASAPLLTARLPAALLNERNLPPALLGGLLSYGAQQ